MQTPLVRIEDHGGKDQAQQKCTDQGCQWARRRAAKPDHMDPHGTVANAVAESSNQQDLLCCEDRECCPRIARKKKVADQQRQGPVDDDCHNPAPSAGNGPGSRFRKSQSLPRVLGNAGGVRSGQPGTNVSAIYHCPSLAVTGPAQRVITSPESWMRIDHSVDTV